MHFVIFAAVHTRCNFQHTVLSSRQYVFNFVLNSPYEYIRLLCHMTPYSCWIKKESICLRHKSSVSTTSEYFINNVLILYNDQHNAQVSNLFIYLLLPYMFRAFF
jgi:hypothetical protein